MPFEDALNYAWLFLSDMAYDGAQGDVNWRYEAAYGDLDLCIRRIKGETVVQFMPVMEQKVCGEARITSPSVVRLARTILDALQNV